MSSLQILEITLISLLVVLILLSTILGPILRKKTNKKREEQLSKIISTLKEGDKILLASGIRGFYVKRKNDVISVEIAKGVIVKVDKHSIMGIYK